MPYVRKRPPLSPCPVETVLALVGGKWKARILRVLAEGGATFGGLRRRLSGVTQQVLSTQLAALETSGLVRRSSVMVRSAPASLFVLTPEAESLLPVLDVVAVWGGRRLAASGVTWAVDQGPIGYVWDDDPVERGIWPAFPMPERQSGVAYGRTTGPDRVGAAHADTAADMSPRRPV